MTFEAIAASRRCCAKQTHNFTDSAMLEDVLTNVILCSDFDTGLLDYKMFPKIR